MVLFFVLLLIFVLFPQQTNAQMTADTVNYFTTWNCSSQTGISKISRMNILPEGKHASLQWKDSLFINYPNLLKTEPTIYFTVGDYNPEAVIFSLKKATLTQSNNQITWDIEDIFPSSHGISSFDGSESDFIMNEYFIPGWGPTANKPGDISTIPGVHNTHMYPNTSGYPLWGTGPLGLTTIRETIVDEQYPDPNTRSCLHMNPTLFNYSGNTPHAFAAQLFTQTVSTGCTLPDGRKLQPGYYIYRFKNNTEGWQLDIDQGLIYDTHGLDYAFNAVYQSVQTEPEQTKFLKAIWDGKIELITKTQSTPATNKVILDCSNGPNVTFAEPTGNESKFYFLADPPPHYSDHEGKRIYIHDIFLAEQDTPIVTVTNTPISGDGNNDSKVNGIDYIIWLNHYFQYVFGPENGDYNNNGKVDGLDYVIWLTNYNP